jgi:hypothetical protein
MEDPSVSGAAEMENLYKREQHVRFDVDIEQTIMEDHHLRNDTIRNFVWQGVTVTVNDHKTKQPKNILQDVSGVLQAGKQSLVLICVSQMLM